jgi:hypothetical protein
MAALKHWFHGVLFVSLLGTGCAEPELRAGDAGADHPGEDADAGDPGDEDAGDRIHDAGSDAGVCSRDSQCDAELPASVCVKGVCVDPWSCLSERSGEPAGTISLLVTVQDSLDRDAPEGLTAVLCRSADSACAEPLAGPIAGDAEGKVSFVIEDVPAVGFEGFVRFTAPESLPLDLVFARPLTHDFAKGETDPLLMIRAGSVEALGDAIGRDVSEAESALVLFELHGCAGQPAADLRVTAEPAAGEIFFSVDEALVPNVTAESTNETGKGGLLNVAPGVRTLRVVHAPSGRELHELRVVARAGSVIVTHLLP